MPCSLDEAKPVCDVYHALPLQGSLSTPHMLEKYRDYFGPTISFLTKMSLLII